jgi:signal transduction histidine kinase/ligand-binding sensor domain-containing protein
MVRCAATMTGSVRRWSRLCPHLWLLVLLYCPSSGLAQYRFDAWTTENGLPNNWVVAIRQTHDGYLWLATQDGLARFDGVRFHVFSKVNVPEMTSNKFSYGALWEDHQGTLWMGTTDGGVIRYHDGVFTSLTMRDGLPSNHVIRIDGDTAGSIWIFTTSGVVQWRDGRLVHPGRSLDAYLASPRNIWDGGPLGLWRLTASGWQRFAYGEWAALPLPPDLHDPAKLHIESMAEDFQRQLWYCLRDRPHDYYRVSEGRLTVFRRIPQTPATQICCQDREGRLWMSNHYGVVGFWKDDRFTSLPGIVTSNILQVLEDREGNLWIATLDHGLYRLKKQVITMIRRPGSLEPNLIGPMLQDRNGVVWVRSGGFSRLQDGRFKTFFRRCHSHASWDWANWFSTLYEDRDGSLWAGTWDGGILRFKNGRLHEEKSLSSQIKGRLYGILRDHAGDLWFGGDQGLYRLHNDHFTHYAAGDGLPEGGVSVLCEDREHTLWIGTRSGLFRYLDGFFTPMDGLRGSYITALYEDDTGILWVGTYDAGLNRLARGPTGIQRTRYTTEQGLYNNRAYQIVEDNLGYLWMSCDLGLYRTRKQELNDFAAGRLVQITSTHFGQADGLTSQCNGEAQPMAFKARDGRLWFSTQDGIAVVDPSVIPVSPSPPVVKIEECLLELLPVACRSAVQMKPGQTTLEINYTALSFIESEEIRFSYRLEGLDRDWTEAGTRRSAYYSHLPPGQYVFHVIAASSDGVWNAQGETLPVVVLPPFYRTWWFLGLMLISVAGTIVLAWRYRVLQLKRVHVAQQAFSRQLIASQEAERKRIAAELHDSLGQHLVIIKNLALISLNKGESDGEARAQMEEVSAEASQALSEVREISYNLRPYQLDRIGLTKAIDAIVKKASSATNIVFTVELDEIDNVFPKGSEINFYRIVQECINNLMKHSQATQASVAVRHAPDELVLVIHDNGKGFSPGSVDPAQSPGGFGLIGISERAQLLGGRLVVHSTPNQGTTLNIKIPLGDDRHE